jgi:hypothetical protein
VRTLPSLILLLLLAQPASASRLEDVAFAEDVEAGAAKLELRSVGLLRYRVLFKAYAAGLYLPPETPAHEALADVPKRLEIEYFWSIDGEAFGRAADELLARQLPAAQLERLRPRLAKLHALYRDVGPGDRYAITYVPGRGTELSLNGVALGSVPGADFASAYFGIWLGDDPLDASLRQQLLGGG